MQMTETGALFRHRNPHRPIIATPWIDNPYFLEEAAFCNPPPLSLYPCTIKPHPPPRPFLLEYNDQGSNVRMWRKDERIIMIEVDVNRPDVLERAQLLVKAMNRRFRWPLFREAGAAPGSQ